MDGSYSTKRRNLPMPTAPIPAPEAGLVLVLPMRCLLALVAPSTVTMSIRGIKPDDLLSRGELVSSWLIQDGVGAVKPLF